MNSTTRKTIAVLALGSASLLTSLSSHAAVISYDFTVTIDTVNSALFNQSFAGSFSYDDAQLPVVGFNGEDLYALQAFTFDFAGNVYGLADLMYGDAAVLASLFLGIDAGGMAFSFLPANDPFPASFAYDFTGGDFGTGSVMFTRAAEAPEPASALLLGGSLLVLRGLQSRRKV